jgi:hypothetical protein
MNTKDIRYVYTVIPTLEVIENAELNSRWCTERFREYVLTLIGEYLPNSHYDIYDNRLTIKTKITEEKESEMRIKSPGIFIEFIKIVDINLEEIVDKLKEASFIALKLDNYDVAGEINKLLREMCK